MKRLILSLALSATAALFVLTASAEEKKAKRILLITESRGFRHGCVTRHVKASAEVDPKALAAVPGVRDVKVNKDKDGKVTGLTATYDGGGRVDPEKGSELKVEGKGVAVALPCVVEKAFAELARASGDFEVVCSQAARKEITAENLKNFDAVFFYTTGDLGLSDLQKSDLISFVKSGKGFAGSHSATDTYYGWKEYGELIGGYFDGHPWHQKVKVIVEDGKHPATKHLGDSFEITDEIYQFRTPYSRKNLRVLMRLDRAVDRTSVSVNGKKLADQDELQITIKDGKPVVKVNGSETDVKNLDFSGPRGNRKDGDNALAWVQEYGKGRVFYTALGHRDEVWKDEALRQAPARRAALRAGAGERRRDAAAGQRQVTFRVNSDRGMTPVAGATAPP